MTYANYPYGYVKGVGPAAPPNSQCTCGREAVAQCQGCGVTLCRACWWKHSHTTRIAANGVTP